MEHGINTEHRKKYKSAKTNFGIIDSLRRSKLIVNICVSTLTSSSFLQILVDFFVLYFVVVEVCCIPAGQRTLQRERGLYDWYDLT